MNKTTHSRYNNTYKNQRGSHVNEAAHHLLDESKKFFSELYEGGKDRLYDYQSDLKSYTNQLSRTFKEKPITYLLVAGGIGYLLAKIIRK